jgi:hypothetical protein
MVSRKQANKIYIIPTLYLHLYTTPLGFLHHVRRMCIHTKPMTLTISLPKQGGNERTYVHGRIQTRREGYVEGEKLRRREDEKTRRREDEKTRRVIDTVIGMAYVVLGCRGR